MIANIIRACFSGTMLKCYICIATMVSCKCSCWILELVTCPLGEGGERDTTPHNIGTGITAPALAEILCTAPLFTLDIPGMWTLPREFCISDVFCHFLCFVCVLSSKKGFKHFPSDTSCGFYSIGFKILFNLFV